MYTLIPGYLVDARFIEQPDRNTTKEFHDNDLLTARQAAFAYASALAAQKQPTEVFDLRILLTEFDLLDVNHEIPPIALVFNRRFHRTQYIPPADTHTISVSMEASPDFDPLDDTIHLTMDLSKEDEAFRTLAAVRDSLGELVCEHNYYDWMEMPAGTGFVMLTVDGLVNNPFNSFRLLHQALSYATDLIQQYNDQYAPENERLTFGVQPLPLPRQ